MVISFVGSGGKTTAIKRMAAQAAAEGLRVLMTTTTHFAPEPFALTTNDAASIISALRQQKSVLAALPVENGARLGPLSQEVYAEACKAADLVLVEADGSRCLPIKFPAPHEPVIPDNTDEIVIVCGLSAIGHPAAEVCHRLPLAMKCLGLTDDTTLIEAHHIQKLVEVGYYGPLSERYPNCRIRIAPAQQTSLYKRVVAMLMRHHMDVRMIKPEWFSTLSSIEQSAVSPCGLCIILETFPGSACRVGDLLMTGTPVNECQSAATDWTFVLNELHFDEMRTVYLPDLSASAIIMLLPEPI